MATAAALAALQPPLPNPASGSSRRSAARAARIEIWRAEVAETAYLLHCSSCVAGPATHHPLLSPTSSASSSSRHSAANTTVTSATTAEDSLPACFACTRLGAPVAMGSDPAADQQAGGEDDDDAAASQSVSSARNSVWRDVKDLVRRVAVRNTGSSGSGRKIPYDGGRGGDPLSLAAAGGTRPGASTAMYRDQSAGKSRPAPGDHDHDDDDAAISEDSSRRGGLARILGERQARLDRAQKLRERMLS